MTNLEFQRIFGNKGERGILIFDREDMSKPLLLLNEMDIQIIITKFNEAEKNESSEA